MQVGQTLGPTSWQLQRRLLRARRALAFSGTVGVARNHPNCPHACQPSSSLRLSLPEAGPADGSVHPLSAHPNPRKEAPKSAADSLGKAAEQVRTLPTQAPPSGSHTLGHHRLRKPPPVHSAGKHLDSAVTLYASYRAEATQEQPCCVVCIIPCHHGDAKLRNGRESPEKTACCPELQPFHLTRYCLPCGS